MMKTTLSQSSFIFLLLISLCGATESVAQQQRRDETDSTNSASSSTSPIVLRILVHNNPPMVDYVKKFNDAYENSHSNVSINMTVVDPPDLEKMTQESIDNGTVDIVGMFGFANEVERYMKNYANSSDGTPEPLWQKLVREGKLLDLTNQTFLSNYDKSAIEDAGKYKDGVYAINLGLTSYSGMYVNKNLLSTLQLGMPQTFDDLVTACSVVTTSNGNYECMMVGGKDTWPLYVGTYGLLGSIWPNPEGFAKNLWTGEEAWNDASGLEFLRKVQTYSSSLLAENTTKALTHSEAPAWFAKGNTLFFPGGSWDAPSIDAMNPAFEWTYVPFPGSDDKGSNLNLFGKYDQGWAIASDSPTTDEALAYLSAFSDPKNYNDFIKAVGFLPTQRTANLTTQIGVEIQPYINDGKFHVGFEQYWVKPPGSGEWTEAHMAASWFQPFGEWDDSVTLANQAQNDLELGLMMPIEDIGYALSATAVPQGNSADIKCSPGSQCCAGGGGSDGTFKEFEGDGTIGDNTTCTGTTITKGVAVNCQSTNCIITCIAPCEVNVLGPGQSSTGFSGAAGESTGSRVKGNPTSFYALTICPLPAFWFLYYL